MLVQTRRGKIRGIALELMPYRERPTRVDTHATQSSGKPELPDRGEDTKPIRLVVRTNPYRPGQ